MLFKTHRNGHTGKALQQIEKEIAICEQAQIKLSKEIGFYSWRQAKNVAYGGISCVYFAKPIDPTKWKIRYDGFYPKRSNRAGKSLEKKFAVLPCLTIESLNKSVGFKGSIFKRVRLSFSNKEYYLFYIGDDWSYDPPKDCLEITKKEFERLQNNS